MRKKLLALLAILALACMACASATFTAFAREDEDLDFEASQIISLDKTVEDEEGGEQTVRDDSAVYVRFGRFDVDIMTASGVLTQWIKDFATLPDTHVVQELTDRIEIKLPDDDFLSLTEFNAISNYTVEMDQLHGNSANEYLTQEFIDKVNAEATGSENGWNFMRFRMCEGESPADFPVGTQILLQKNMPTLADRTYVPLVSYEHEKQVGLDKTYLCTLTEDGWTLEENGFDRTEVTAVSDPVAGDGSVSFDITFNNPVTAGESATQEELAALFEHIRVNYATAAELNEETPGSITISGGGSVISLTLKSSVLADAEESINTQIAVEKELPVYENKMAIGYETYYNSMVNTFTDEPIEQSYERAQSIKINDISGVLQTEEGYTGFTVVFNKAPSSRDFTYYNAPMDYQKENAAELGLDKLELIKMEVQPAHNTICGAIAVNGKTVAEWMEEQGDDAVKISFQSAGHSMTVSFKDGLVDFADAENPATLKISRDEFYTPSGQMFTKEVNKYYSSQYANWLDEGVAPAPRQMAVTAVSTTFAGNGWICIDIDFERDVGPDMQAAGFVYVPALGLEQDWISENILLNGKTLKELHTQFIELNPAGVIQVQQQKGFNAALLQPKQYVGLVLWVWDGLFKENQDASKPVVVTNSTVEVKSSMLAPCNYQVEKDYKFTCTAEGQGALWLAEGEVPLGDQVEWGEVKLLSVSAPVRDNAGVKFTLTFDKNLTDTFYASFTADDSYLLSYTTILPSAYFYTPALLQSFNKVGLKASVMDKMMFGMERTVDGETKVVTETVRDMLNRETDAGARNNTLMVHVGAWGSLNTIEFYLLNESTWASDMQNHPGANRVENENQEFVFTLLPGLRFPGGVEIKEEVTFRMNTSTGRFENEDTSLLPDNNTEIEYIVYNGKHMEDGERITIEEGAMFNESLFTVKTKSATATYEIVGFEDLEVGENNVLLITVYAEDGTIGDSIEVAVTVNPKAADTENPKDDEKTGCASAAADGGNLFACTVLIVSAFALRRKKI